MSYVLHPNGICETKNIGERTSIGAFSHILSGAQIGEDCIIDDHVFIENKVIVGDRVEIKAGVQLWGDTQVNDDCFIGPNVSFGNYIRLPSSEAEDKISPICIQRKAVVGAGSVILPGVTIGQNALVEAGAVVTHSVPPNAIVTGNPARIRGYVATKSAIHALIPEVLPKEERTKTTILSGQSELRVFPTHIDTRGKLLALEFNTDIPFPPKRFFCVYGVSSTHVRGEHAHKVCQQFLICLSGSLNVILDNGQEREEVILSSSYHGLFIPAGVWSTQYNHTLDTVLAVFASETYDANDYIRNYEEFLDFKQKQRQEVAKEQFQKYSQHNSVPSTSSLPLNR